MSLDCDLWPLAWLAALGVTRPGDAKSLSGDKRALLDVLRDVETRAYYWGDLTRAEADQVLSTTPTVIREETHT